MNVMAQLEFELAFYEIAIQHISYYTTMDFVIPFKFYF